MTTEIKLNHSRLQFLVQEIQEKKLTSWQDIANRLWDNLTTLWYYFDEDDSAFIFLKAIDNSPAEYNLNKETKRFIIDCNERLALGDTKYEYAEATFEINHRVTEEMDKGEDDKYEPVYEPNGTVYSEDMWISAYLTANAKENVKGYLVVNYCPRYSPINTANSEYGWFEEYDEDGERLYCTAIYDEEYTVRYSSLSEKEQNLIDQDLASLEQLLTVAQGA